MATTQRMLIDATRADETRVAIVQDQQLIDFDFESLSKKSVKSNIYLGKIVRIEPSLQAAFVEYGSGRHGFLAFTEIHPDYFRIPIADREDLVQSVEEELDKEEASDLSDEETTETSQEQENAVEAENPQEPESPAEDDARKKYLLYRNYKIQEVIKSKQVVLVQVVKEERGNKGAALTTFISLAGRYSVLMPNALHTGGISRKITETEDRKRLKLLISDLGVPEGMSLIVRTAGLNKTKNEIKKDYSYLIDLWTKIRERTLSASAPSLIHAEPDLIKRILRDVYTPDIQEVLVEGAEAYKEAKAFMKELIPSHAKRVKLYKEEKTALFKAYQVDAQIEQIFSPKVNLKSGGYLIINATEALVAIDVNSGRSTRERHIDSTALKTNLEAAEEVAKQIRIRDLSGLVVIDFIDMNEVRHNIAVEKKLKESLSMDRARIQVGRISQFGLLEMSRQRLRSSILEASSSRCPYCVGSGLMRSKESLSTQLIRVLEELSPAYSAENPLTVFLDSNFAFYMLSERRQALDELQSAKGSFFHFRQDTTLHLVGFKIEDATGKFLGDASGVFVEDKKPIDRRNDGLRKRGNASFNQKNKRGKPLQKERGEELDPQRLETEQPLPANQEDAKPTEDEKGVKKNNRNRRRRRGNRGPREGASPVQQVADDIASHVVNEEKANKQESGQKPEKVVPKEPSKPKGPSDKEKPVEESPKGPSKDGWWKKLLD